LYCTKCKTKTQHSKRIEVSIPWGCFMSLITFGVFIPQWIITAIIEDRRPFRCKICGEPDIELSPEPLPAWQRPSDADWRFPRSGDSVGVVRWLSLLFLVVGVVFVPVWAITDMIESRRALDAGPAESANGEDFGGTGTRE
jgi:hypothetical protein